MPWRGRRSARSGQGEQPRNEGDPRYIGRKLAGGFTAAALLAGCAPEGAQQEVEFRVPVAVEEVGVATLEDRIVTTGTLRAPEIVTLNVLDSGVLEINRGPDGRRLAEGDTVKAGDEIARIVGEDVRVAARLNAAQRAHDAARTELEATREIFSRGLIPKATLDSVESKYETAKVDLERSRRTEDRNRMLTPIDGVVLKLARDADGQLLANGQLVTLGQLVAQIAPLDALIADVDLIGDDVAARARRARSARPLPRLERHAVRRARSCGSRRRSISARARCAPRWRSTMRSTGCGPGCSSKSR